LFFQHFIKRAEIEFGTERQNTARTCTGKRAKSVQFVPHPCASAGAS
jgi:hypothetical protein